MALLDLDYSLFKHFHGSLWSLHSCKVSLEMLQHYQQAFIKHCCEHTSINLIIISSIACLLFRKSSGCPWLQLLVNWLLQFISPLVSISSIDNNIEDIHTKTPLFVLLKLNYSLSKSSRPLKENRIYIQFTFLIFLCQFCRECKINIKLN